MESLFYRQFAALFFKNWIILSKHKFLNLLRCLLFPVGYGAFLAMAQNFLEKPNNYGMGVPAPIHNFTTQFDGSLSLIWADGTNGTGDPSASAIMSHITSGFNKYQMDAVKQVASPTDIPSNCPQNFNLISECYAGIAFNYLPVSPTDTAAINYTISGDGGLVYVNVYDHTSDFETRILPLQLAIDEAFIALRAGQSIPTPLEWPYTQKTNQQQSTDTRLSYVRGLRTPFVIALFICYIGIAYQLPGAFTGERANLLASHMRAMGLLDSARIISWHISISLAYLPAWMTVALIWRYKIFTETNGGLILVVHLLFGFSLASWSFFVAAPFGKSPQLAAIVSTFLSILFASLALVFSRASTTVAAMFTLVFPPGYYIFAIRAICGYESHLMPTNLVEPDPDDHLTLLPIMIVCAIDIFLWPYLGVVLEKRLYGAREPSGGLWSYFCRYKQEVLPPHSSVAISIKNLRKTFAPPIFSWGKGPVTAVSDLSLDIPKSGIFVLLGPNGSGKSTLLSIIANLLGCSSGSITFEGGVSHPPRGTLGIVPQKNVLFPDLTCYQTLQVWHAIKYSPHKDEGEDYEQLLHDCDLGKNIHSVAGTLSEGEKRKLQLAIGLIGGSKIVLVDECTSGVDSISRRALWRTLASSKHDRTIVLTTHFLDEADLLADHVAILATHGKLVTEGSSVRLKTSLGQGYTIHITFDSDDMDEKDPTSSSVEVLNRIRGVVPHCTLSLFSTTHAAYHLKSKDPILVEKVLQLLYNEAGDYHIASADVRGTTIEDIFLDLMESEVRPRTPDGDEKSISVYSTELASTLDTLKPLREISAPFPLILTDGRARPPLSQALTIFYKRMLIARRSWLTPVLTVLTVVCGACAPLLFLSGQAPSCTVEFKTETVIPLYWRNSSTGILDFSPTTRILESPPNITAILGQSTASTLMENVSDNATFVSTIQQDYLDIPIGGISIDVETGDALVAWDVTPTPGLMGPMLLNLATSILYNRALNASNNTASTSNAILANYASFPPITEGVLVNLKWVAFFGAAMAIYPAFFALYVSRERRSSVQAMQFSNGLFDPIGLWLGHLLWDSILGVLVATIIIIVFAAVSNQFYGLGLFWIVLVQYGMVGALFSYCVSRFMPSSFTSFVAVAGYQVVMYILYLAGYLLTLRYAKTSQASQIITVIHFTLSLLSPIASVLRSAFVSVNLFSLLCNGSTHVTTSSMGDIMRYGGPILYLFVDGFALLGILVWADFRVVSVIPRCVSENRKRQVRISRIFNGNKILGRDIAWEAWTAAHSSDPLRVLHVTKSFDGKKVVEDVSFSVPRDGIFAMLGADGAGKTTTFDMIRGDVVPDKGIIEIGGVSVMDSPRQARLALGVCPQFTAIDTQLTVREHLLVYGRLKGLVPGPELDANVESLMVATSLNMYANRLASQLSRGDQRKLSLTIALIGNPSVLLVDEFSSGVDALIKREMWATLRKGAVGRAVVITTHSAEEAYALANKVGIMSKKMITIGTTQELAARYAKYYVHFSCATRQDAISAQVLMSHIPGVRLVDDVAMRFEVPIRECGHGRRATSPRSRNGTEGGHDGTMSLAQLFHVLATRGHFSEYTVEKSALENAFLKVVQQNNMLEECLDDVNKALVDLRMVQSWNWIGGFFLHRTLQDDKRVRAG